MKKIEERQEEIRNILSINEHIRVEELAARLHVTGATIRSDLREMEKRQEISRSRGGVSLVRPQIVDLKVKEKIFINAEQKMKIAMAAVQLIKNRDSIMMMSGTTMEAMARQIGTTVELNVVTPSIPIAFTLAAKENVEILVLGGKLTHTSLSVRDEYTIQGLNNVFCTKLFTSCDGLDFGTGVVTATNEEARLTSTMMKSAAKTILLADSSKFGKTGFGRISRLEDIDTIITDDGIAESYRNRLEDMGIEVIIAQ